MRCSPARTAFPDVVQYPGQRDPRVAGEIGEHAKILALVHQVQRPALNEQIDHETAKKEMRDLIDEVRLKALRERLLKVWAKL
jgi:hypothetical protein